MKVPLKCSGPAKKGHTPARLYPAGIRSRDVATLTALPCFVSAQHRRPWPCLFSGPCFQSPAWLSLEFPCCFSPFSMVCPTYFPPHTYTALHLRHRLANSLSPFLGTSMCFGFALFEVCIAAGLLSSINASSPNAKGEPQGQDQGTGGREKVSGLARTALRV